MTLKLSENIRGLRKERGLTQEQLAEAMGVSVAAVSKWETGASSPDLLLLVSLAEFFETSVDALLGYACPEGGLERAIEELRELTHAKRYDEGMARAETLAVKYPNSFRLIHSAACLYNAAGYERRDARIIRRAIELYRRACALVEQNGNPRVSAVSLQNEIALLEVELGEYEQAIEHLKANNAGGNNDDRIGFIYAVHLRDADKALPYLSDTLMENVFSLYRMVVGFANAFSLKGRSAESLEILRWLYGLLEGLTTSRVGPLDKYQSTVLLLCAEVCAEMQRPEAAREYLAQALARAKRFDAVPSYRMTDLRFFHGDPGRTVYDNIGLTAVQALHNGLLQDSEGNAALLRVWEELTAE